MSTSAFSKRVSEFKEKFQQLLGPRRQGYDDLEGLERPLVGAVDEEDDEGQQRFSRPGGNAYQPPLGVGSEGGAGGDSFPVALPSQAEEIQEVSALAKDASEILWEMVAMGETGAGLEEMKSRAEMLQGQLRGLINDWVGDDEKLYAAAFEAFDMISRCLDDPQAGAPIIPPEEPFAPQQTTQHQPEPPTAPITTTIVHSETAPERPGALRPAPSPATAAAPATADLISFD